MATILEREPNISGNGKQRKAQILCSRHVSLSFGSRLHVGHPLGYIASDIYSRYKRLKGFNVLHPMGYDAYGLPAEQYAIQTGQHPAITTTKNINRYREQLDKIGFCFDWSREIRTCDPEYYKWTQWAFIPDVQQLLLQRQEQARPISELIKAFAQQGTEGLNAACGQELQFTAEEWNAKSEKEQQQILMNYRIAYLGDTMVNWCPALGRCLPRRGERRGLHPRRTSRRTKDDAPMVPAGIGLCTTVARRA